MISASSGANFHEPITGRFSAAAPMAVPSNGGRKVLGAPGLENPRKNFSFPRGSPPRRSPDGP